MKYYAKDRLTETSCRIVHFFLSNRRKRTIRYSDRSVRISDPMVKKEISDNYEREIINLAIIGRMGRKRKKIKER